MLCEITVGVANPEFRVSLFQTLKERPTHDAHEGCCFERLPSLDFEFDLPSMESLVTGLAQRDEIVRRIASGPSALNVVNIEYRIFGSADKRVRPGKVRIPARSKIRAVRLVGTPLRQCPDSSAVACQTPLFRRLWQSPARPA